MTIKSQSNISELPKDSDVYNLLESPKKGGNDSTPVDTTLQQKIDSMLVDSGMENENGTFVYAKKEQIKMDTPNRSTRSGTQNITVQSPVRAKSPVRNEIKGADIMKTSPLSTPKPKPRINVNIATVSSPDRKEAPKNKQLMATMAMGGMKLSTYGFGKSTSLNPLLKGNVRGTTTPTKSVDISTKDCTPIKEARDNKLKNNNTSKQA